MVANGVSEEMSVNYAITKECNNALHHYLQETNDNTEISNNKGATGKMLLQLV